MPNPPILTTQKDKILLEFERHNSKYNRLWEQLTNICLFILASAVAYLIAFLEISTTEFQTISSAVRANNLLAIGTHLLLGMAIIIAFATGILVMNLITSGSTVHKITRENKL